MKKIKHTVPVLSVMLVLLFVFTVFCGCTAEDEDSKVRSSEGIEVVGKDVLDEEFLKLMYDSNYQYPDGFYQDAALLDPGYCSVEPSRRSVYYMNTAHFEPWDENNSVFVELHTLDKEEARNWSNSAVESSYMHWYRNNTMIQEKENETEKYFEFVLVSNDLYPFSYLNRVHRSDYFIPLCDKMKFEPNFDYTLGIYNGEIKINKVKELIEYLWCMTLFADNKVVVSTISEKDGKFEHYIQSLRMVGGDLGRNDVIFVYDNKFILDKETKILTFAERKKVEEVRGNYHPKQDSQPVPGGGEGNDFADDRVVVVLSKEASLNFKTYTPEDFPEVKFIRVDDSTKLTMELVRKQLEAERTGDWSELKEHVDNNMLVNVANFRRILDLILPEEERSQEKVKEAINLLKGRKDVEHVGPDYFMFLIN